MPHSENTLKYRFLVLGRAGIDLYADPPGTETEHAARFSAALGGSAANIAVAIVKLGGAASLLTRVSDDSVGRYVTNELRRYGVATDHVHVAGGEARTSLAVVETRAVNCQSVIYRNGAADFLLAGEDVNAVDFADFGTLIVTGTSLAVEPSRGATFRAMELAREAGLVIILDVDYRPYSWAGPEEAAAISLQAARASDIVIGNDVEFDVMGSAGNGLALAQELAGASARTVIYKKGEKGAVSFGCGQSFATGIYPVTPLKPTGAGDAFMGGFVTGLAAGLPLQDCVARGSAAAAITVMRVGCAPAIPTHTELDDFMRRHTMAAAG
ncbi:5-dehydro-2-deoxygluconokinase [Aestuariivirga sp.]|uniref:5-dehydro-2-deoxygluconokinase n=1 Tax=Aestuariivirga sp. TaxID=2650926 RepID=UPI0035944F31